MYVCIYAYIVYMYVYMHICISHHVVGKYLNVVAGERFKKNLPILILEIVQLIINCKYINCILIKFITKYYKNYIIEIISNIVNCDVTIKQITN